MRSAKLLIDGYNLLFQSDLVGKGRGPGWLERARKRLLLLLSGHLSESEQRATTVIFDASQRGEPVGDYLFMERIEVRFATEHPEADDLLEELIRACPQPKQLQVISSDQRIRRCARARRAESIDSETFLSQLARSPRQPVSAAEDQAQDAKLSEADVEYWMREFGQEQ